MCDWGQRGDEDYCGVGRSYSQIRRGIEEGENSTLYRGEGNEDKMQLK